MQTLHKSKANNRASTNYKAADVAVLIDISQGPPTCHTLPNTLNQWADGARNIDCTYSNYGMSWCIFPQAMYAMLFGKNNVAPLQPPLVLPYLPNNTQQQNAVISIQWQKNKELYNQMMNVGKVAISTLKSKLEPKYRKQLSNMFIGMPDCTFEDFFACIFCNRPRICLHL